MRPPQLRLSIFSLPNDQPARFSSLVFPAAAIERLYDHKVGTTPVEEGSPHERPHKPLLLMAALDLLDGGLATPHRLL